MTSQDERFMKQALSLAHESIGLCSPNPPVGCLIARDGEIMGRGRHEFAGRDHAEARALAEAGAQARGATVYVTLEPCTHFGRTPPCAPALIAAGVRRVVIGHADPNPLVAGRGIELLRAAGVAVEVGCMQPDAARLIEPFACHVTTGLPLVVAKAGMSLDGRIAAAGNPGERLSCPAAQKFGQKLRAQLDALLVGIGTVLADDPLLSYRGSLPKVRPLAAVVLDSRLRIPSRARLLHSIPTRQILIFCRPDASPERRRELERGGAEVVSVPGNARGLEPEEILRELGKRAFLGVLVEGGSEIHWSFLASGLIDKFYFIMAPIILGGRNSVPVAGGPGYSAASAAPRFRIGRHFRTGSDLVLETYPEYSRSILSPWRRPGM